MAGFFIRTVRSGCARMERIIDPNSATGHTHRESGKDKWRATNYQTPCGETISKTKRKTKKPQTSSIKSNWKMGSSVTGKRGDDMQVDQVFPSSANPISVRDKKVLVD
jgi:hypothetical protein